MARSKSQKKKSDESLGICYLFFMFTKGIRSLYLNPIAQEARGVEMRLWRECIPVENPVAPILSHFSQLFDTIFP
jgi:hypothetical protein